MKTSKQLSAFNQSVIALAVLAAFGPARAQDIGEVTAPGNTLSVGVGAASGDEKDRARFGMFNGLRKNDYHGLFGFSVLDRDAASGKWFTVEGRNLGLDSREVSFSYRKLGDMKLWGEYSELVRHDPRTINTGLIGAGTTTPTVVGLAAPGAGSELNLELKRKGFSLNAEKWFGGALQLEANFKNEDKTGARFFGIGYSCTANSAQLAAGTTCAGTTGTVSGNAIFLLPEPVNSTIRQIDLRANWSSGKLNLSGGYYGSFYTNANGNITPTIPATGLVGVLGTPVTLDPVLRANMQLPVALWPDNQAQQLYFAGNYKLTPKTKINFKYAYTHATQDESFLGMGLTGAPAGRSNLGGKVDSTKAQVGFTSHPLDKLHVHGNLKYEERNDKTPIANYNTERTNLTTTTYRDGVFTNGQFSPKIWQGKLEASYKLPANYQVVGEVEYEYEDLGQLTPTVNVAGLSGIRQKLEETGYRLELKKMMSETFNGSISYKSSERKGDSPWLKLALLGCQGQGGLFNSGTGAIEADPSLLSTGSAGSGATPATLAANCALVNNGIGGTATSRPIFPFLFMDRNRDKLKLMGTWMPNDRLSMTFFLEDGKDKYTAPVSDHGLRDAGNRMYAVDAAYTLSDAWKLTGYWSRGEQKTNAGHSTGYDATLEDIADSLGVGLAGKVSARFRLGADLTYLNDVLKYKQNPDPNASVNNVVYLAAVGGLPDVTYRLTRLKLFGEYALDKTSYLRVDLVHQNTKFNEWTYNYNNTPFFYSDNTTLNAKENQSVTFVGVSYIYRFR